MRDRISAGQLMALYTLARRSSPDHALRGLGEAAIGRPAYLAVGGYAIHTDSGEIVDPSQPNTSLSLTCVMDDQTLGAWGLQLSQISGPARASGLDTELLVASIALRLGLLMRCLDMAFLHLAGRESFGQKLLHHQLMKARFATINAEAQRCLEELTLPRAWSDLTALQALQREISAQFRHAAKLMGGHGFIEGRCHTLEFLATLLAALFSLHRDHRGLAAAGGRQ